MLAATCVKQHSNTALHRSKLAHEALSNSITDVEQNNVPLLSDGIFFLTTDQLKCFSTDLLANLEPKHKEKHLMSGRVFYMVFKFILFRIL